MKVMLRNTPQGLSAYVPKKDLEEPVVAQENAGLWGGAECGRPAAGALSPGRGFDRNGVDWPPDLCPVG